MLVKSSDTLVIQREVESFQVGIHSLPIELVLHILNILSIKDLGQVACVCKALTVVASDDSLWDVKKLFPSLKVSIIDQTVWEKIAKLATFNLDLSDLRPLDNSILIPMLKHFASFEIEDDLGVTVLTIPKGLTFNSLAKTAHAPINGNRTGFSIVWSHFAQKFGNIPVNETYRVLITNAILKGSRDMTLTEQEELIKKTGCELVEALPVATLAIITFISSNRDSPPTRLFHSGLVLPEKFEPGSVTLCAEKVDGETLAVGYSPEGLCIKGAKYDLLFGGAGVAVMQRL